MCVFHVYTLVQVYEFMCIQKYFHVFVTIRVGQGLVSSVFCHFFFFFFTPSVLKPEACPLCQTTCR